MEELSYRQIYYRDHKERITLLKKAWIEANPEKIRLSRQKQRKKDREKRRVAALVYRKTSHGRLMNCLLHIKNRCNSPTDKNFNRYGGRGIRNFLTLDDLQFIWARDGAENMKRPSIDRIDNDGNYERINCRFIEQSENSSRPKSKIQNPKSYD